eukprot:CAMPEP_0178396348 /NCGR_PEP_ID=MMETSP0689_2-20121128/13683_1 /TAXON_ID=160604 /ORGANISM="Amphidinium massartii, Strain CS-259" /LENGTH=263 /DNA_ID=CAMNT_0020017021 /DNA_START=468 /DNA_END=1256 /DNA_ORIENTATION=-
MAYGESVTFLLRTLQRSPQWLETSHYLHNPIIDKEDLFGGGSSTAPPGAGAGWKEALDNQRQQELVRLLRGKGKKYWVTFDTEVQDERVRESYDSLARATTDRILAEGHLLTVMQVTKEDLCEAQIGERLPVRFLVPSRDFKDELPKFLKTNAVPEYLPVHLRMQEKALVEQAGFAAAGGAPASLPALRMSACNSQPALGAAEKRMSRVVTAHHMHSIGGGLAAWARSQNAKEVEEYEQDLSYGVRQQMQDAIDDSLRTYQDE